jgi:hypothetical protein
VDEDVPGRSGDRKDLKSGNWYLDDLPPMMFVKMVLNSHGFVNASDIEDLWIAVSITPLLSAMLKWPEAHLEYFP